MNMNTKHPEHPEPPAHPAHLANPDVAHEHSDINVRAVFWCVVILLVSAIAIYVAVWGLFKVFEVRTARQDPPLPPLSRGAGPHPPPTPRLQTRPIEDLKRSRAGEEAQLTGYSWVDRQAGIVRIPIDRAKQLYVERAASAPQTPAAQAETRPRDTASGRFVRVK